MSSDNIRFSVEERAHTHIFLLVSLPDTHTQERCESDVANGALPSDYSCRYYVDYDEHTRFVPRWSVVKPDHI